MQQIPDPDRSGGNPIPPPDIAGFPGLLGLIFTSPASGKDRVFNASMSAQDLAEWVHYDWFINMNTFLKGCFLLSILYFVGNGVNRRIRTIICVNADNQEFFRKPNLTGAMWKRHIFYAPAIGSTKYKRCLSLSKRKSTPNPPYRMSPTRIQTFSIVLYFAVTIAFCVIDIRWSKGKRYVLEDLRNRTGVLAIENMLPAFLFIMRSNPVMWMTGISRECNTFIHIWFSYAATLLSLVHGALWMASMVIYGSWRKMGILSGKNYLWNAYMATAALILFSITSMSAVRRTYFDVFANIHSILTWLFLAGIYMHMKFIPHKTLVVATILLWALERGLRILQLLWRNAAKKRDRTPAVVELLPGAMLRITLTPVRGFRALGGRYIHLWVPSVGRWDSHPFAPAWDSTPLDEDLSIVPTRKVAKKKKKKANGDEEVVEVKDEEVVEVKDVEVKKTVTILVRRRNGFTNKLAKKVEEAGGTLEIPAWVEGPYTNSNVSFVSYGHIVLIAGGAGITAQLARAAELYSLRSRSLAVTRKIRIYWYVQQRCHIEWIQPFITKMKNLSVLQDLIKIRIFITKETPSMASLPASDKWDSEGSDNTWTEHRYRDGRLVLPRHISYHDRRDSEIRPVSDATDDRSHYAEDELAPEKRKDRFSLLNMYESPVALVQVEYQRPTIESLIDEEMRKQVGAMILASCGPPSMNNEVRTVARSSQLMGCLDFVEEGFTN